MTPPSTTTTPASTTVPWLLRMLLLNCEPLFAIGGIILVLTRPEDYTRDTTRSAMTTVDPKSTFIFTQLAGAWAHIAFSEAIILRFVDDIRVWKLVCIGVLLSDILYCHSLAQAVGGWTTWSRVSEWLLYDWVATALTWPFVLTRLAIISNVGLNRVSERKLD